MHPPAFATPSLIHSSSTGADWLASSRPCRANVLGQIDTEQCDGHGRLRKNAVVDERRSYAVQKLTLAGSLRKAKPRKTEGSTNERY